MGEDRAFKRVLRAGRPFVTTAVVLVGLFTVSELVSSRFLDQKRRIERQVELLVRTAKGGDPVATTMRTLETYPAVNPSPLVTDVLLLWRNQPLARKTQLVNPQSYGLNATWTVENNSLGYRGPEREPVRSDTFRVLCVGDSITYGFNVDQEDTYPRQLERLLRARHTGRPIEVLNTGVPGWSWLQGLRFLELEGLARRPSLVIAAHGTNDQFLRARATDRERLGHVENPLVRGMLLAAARLSRTNTFQLITQFLPPPTDATQDSPGCQAQIKAGLPCRRLSLADIDATVTELADRTAAAGVSLLLLNVDFTETPAVTGLRAVVERRRLPFIDFVGRVTELREADEAARASRLGLLPARDSPAESRRHMQNVTLRVQVNHPDGPVSVRGYFNYAKPVFQYELPMYDDGTHGDQIANDGVFSTSIEVLPGVQALEYNYFIGDAPELASVPPMPPTMGLRHLPLHGDRVAPVESFGRLFLMAERTHPNREGQAVIAAGIADWIEKSR
jgi:lysophospholipase L1-like esterase